MRSDPPAATEARFWARVWQCQHPACRRCCWPFMTATGLYYFCTPPEGCYFHQEKRTRDAHYVAYVLTYQPFLPWGRALYICHQCDWRLCCNPRHLLLGSPSDNSRDRWNPAVQRMLRDPVYLPDGRMLGYKNGPLHGPQRDAR
jgi:HNH endonuclease